MPLRPLIIAMLCQFYFLSFGQVSEYLVDTNKMWSNLWFTADGGPPPQMFITDYIRFGGDTTIGQHSYKHIYRCYDSTLMGWYVIGSIREDSMHRVYFIKSQDTVERMLYDFSIEIGDTVNFYNYEFGAYSWNFIVTIIDSVFIYDRYIKRFRETTSPWAIVWLEGIGDLSGVLYIAGNQTMGAARTLLCYYDHGILKYSKPGYPAYNQCYITNSYPGIQNPEVPEPRIYPNPFSSVAIIEYNLPQPSTVHIDIYNQLGKLVDIIEDDQLKGINRVTWNPVDLPNGMYYVRLRALNHITTARVILQR